MAYCRSCGNLIPENGRFCTSCGKGQTEGQPASSASPLPPVIRVVTEKSGGWLALKGFAVSMIIAAITRAAVQKNDRGLLATGVILAFGIGAAYIVTNLRKWKRENVPVSGSGLAWIVAILLVLGCVGGLRLVIADDSTPGEPNTATATTDTNRSEPVSPSPTRTLSPQEMKEARNTYAREFDQKLIEAGIESRTLAWGPDDTTLQITDALAGRVTANEFGKKLDFDRLRELGFKKVVLTNGFGGDAGASFAWYVQ
jgi:hypothetical protein